MAYTKCVLTRASNVIRIPDEIFNQVNPEGKNAVIVLPVKLKKFTVFFTDADKTLYIRLNINKNRLIEEFFMGLQNALENNKLHSLFNTGICLENNNCTWEGVFEYYEDSREIEKIKEAFLKIKTVESVETKLMTVSEG